MCIYCEIKNQENIGHDSSKRSFMKMVGGVSLGTLTAALPLAAVAADDHPMPKPKNTISPDDAIKRLVAGNARYASNQQTKRDSMNFREPLSKSQNPYACILSCADSRVSPELVFDEDRGDLFVTRVAGNYVTTDLLASLEYGTAVAGAPVIMVLGHESCGAIKAAIKADKEMYQYPGHIQSITTALAQSVRETAGQSGDPVDLAVRQNVKINVDRLKRATPVLSKLVEQNKLKIIGGRYDLDTGIVEIIA
jgi:carbonic anhydrase